MNYLLRAFYQYLGVWKEFQNFSNQKLRIKFLPGRSQFKRVVFLFVIFPLILLFLTVLELLREFRYILCEISYWPKKLIKLFITSAALTMREHNSVWNETIYKRVFWAILRNIMYLFEDHFPFRIVLFHTKKIELLL